MLGFHGISVAPISALAASSITMTVDTAAAVNAAGQSVIAAIGMAMTTAAGISMSGQTIVANLGMAIATSAMVTATGQEVDLRPRFSTGPLFVRNLGGRTAVYWKGRSA